MAQIDVKELTIIRDDGMVWFSDKSYKNTIVFPTAKDFLDALAENGQLKETMIENMKNEIQIFKETVNVVGSLEKAIKFMHGMDTGLTEEQEDELIDPQPIFAFIDYCIYTGVHYEEITKYMIPMLFYSTENSEMCDNPVFINNDKSSKYWFMSEDEIGYDEDIIMYKLSPEEQEQLQKQLKELRDSDKSFNLCECELYVKGMVLLLEEILKTFGE